VQTEITNMAGFCMFGDIGMPPGLKLKYVSAVTGFEYPEDEERKLGLRSYVMRHAFNVREGMTRSDHRISDRIVGKPPLEDGPLKGITVDTEKLADNFFGTLGWDLQTLVPPQSTFEELGGMEEVERDLYGVS